MSSVLEKNHLLKPWKIYLVPLNILRLHEEVSEDRTIRLFEEVIRDGILKKPLLVENRYYIILDGHHRYAVLERLKARSAPIFLVEYSSPLIEVHSWRSNWNVTKEMVVEAAITGRKLPFKTSRHILKDVEIPDIHLPISWLMEEPL